MNACKVIILIFLCLISLVSKAGEINGFLDKILEVEIDNPSTYPSKHIIGTFGEKVVSEYAIGIVNHKEHDLRILNFYTFPNNITKDPVILNFTVEFYDLNGDKLGESKRTSRSAIEPTDPNIRPSSLHGANVKEKDFSKVKKYKITYTEE